MATSHEGSTSIEEFQKRTDLPTKGSIWNGKTVVGIGLAEDTETPLVVCEEDCVLRVYILDHPIDRPVRPEHLANLQKAGPLPRKGTVWKHYKGNEYEIIGIGLGASMGSPLVIYEDTTGKYNFWWVRDLDNWRSKTDEGYARFTSQEK